MKTIIKADRAQSGFSLIELMIAMMVTVIITGAVYGLIASGQTSFVYEPERAARQQSIRIGMDLISHDIMAAGVGASNFAQALQPGLNNVACGDGPDVDALNDCLASTTLVGENTDELGILTNIDGIDLEPACGDNGFAVTTATLKANWSYARVGDLVIVYMTDGRWTLRYVTAIDVNPAPPAGCTAGARRLQFAGSDPNNPKLNTAQLCDAAGFGTASRPGAAGDCLVSSVGFGEVVTYQIRRDAWDGMPSLWRRSSSTAPDGQFFTANAFDLIARGIEDMQVQYAAADDDPLTPIPEENWVSDAPVVANPAAPTTADYATLIAKVRVTLSARTDRMDNGRTIMGATEDVNGGNIAARGSLTSTTVVRSALNQIGQDKNQYRMWQ